MIDTNQITPAEKNVLALVAKGQSSKQIAAVLHRSENTICNHRKNILAKTGLPNMVAVIAKYNPQSHE